MAHVDPKKPIGGHVLAHASTTNNYILKKEKDSKEFARFSILLVTQ